MSILSLELLSKGVLIQQYFILFLSKEDMCKSCQGVWLLNIINVPGTVPVGGSHNAFQTAVVL